jgi:WD40 repeat protein
MANQKRVRPGKVFSATRAILPLLALALPAALVGCDKTMLIGTTDDPVGTGGAVSPSQGGAGGMAGSSTQGLLTGGVAGGGGMAGSTMVVETGGVGGQAGAMSTSPGCASISTTPGVLNPCGPTFGVAYSSDGQLLAASFENANPSVRLWRLSDGMPLPDPSGQGRETTYDVAFSPDGSKLVAAGYQSAHTPENSGDRDKAFVRVWDVTSGTLLQTLAPSCGWYADSVEFSPDGTLLLTAGYQGAVELWRVADWKVMMSIPVPTTVHNAHFSPDGSRILVANFAGEAWAYDLATQAAVLGPLAIASEMSDASYAPDASQIATTWQTSESSDDNSVRIYDASTGQLVQSLTGHARYISHVVWVDQDRLVSDDWGGTVILWQRDATGLFRRGASWPTASQALGLAVAPDKTRVVVAGNASGLVFLEL